MIIGLQLFIVVFGGHLEVCIGSL